MDICLYNSSMTIAERKNGHIDVCLHEDVSSRISSGFENYRLINNPLPEKNFADFSVETGFLGKTVSAPVMISSMTGGTEYGERINRNLIEAAAAMDLPFAVGSQRICLTDPGYQIISYRKFAPKIPILANLGAVQLNYGFSRDHYIRAAEMIDADALILHLNPLQELIQQGGDTDFSGLLDKIAELCADFPVPVIVKEVGWGIGAETAKKLADAGVSMIDVAGAGGTSWSRVESHVSGNSEVLALAEPFDSWGIPTAECLRTIHEQYPEIRLIASGGIKNGIDAAKAVALGAEMCGMAAALLPSAALGSADDVCTVLDRVIRQYKIARFLSCGIEKITTAKACESYEEPDTY